MSRPDKGLYFFVSKGLLDPKHVSAIGPALWLFLWFIDHETEMEEGGPGLVHGFTLLDVDQIAEDLGKDHRLLHAES